MRNKLCKFWRKLNRPIDIDNIKTVKGTFAELSLPEASSMVANSQRSIFTYYTLQKGTLKEKPEEWSLLVHEGGTDYWDTEVETCATGLNLPQGIRLLRQKTNELERKYRDAATQWNEVTFRDPPNGLREVEKELRRRAKKPGLLSRALGCTA